MRRKLIEERLLHGFAGQSGLELEAFTERDGQVGEGVLRAGDDWFPVIDGVPRLLRGGLRPDYSDFARKHGLAEPAGATGGASPDPDGQKKTNVTFSDKWRRFQNYGMQSDHQEFLFQWYCEKLGFQSRAELENFYAGKRAVLEVGPGSGFNTRFMAENSSGDVFAADISEAAVTTYGNTSDLENCHVVQADLMDLPFDDGTFDFIIADGVLHHTPDTRAAVEALYRKLAPGGQFFFYVYRAMGAARRFCDEHIRSRFKGLEPEACYEACEPLTELGRELSKLNATITLEKPVEVLGIPAGTHDVQRLIYYNFVKCFWNDAFDFETNNMVNFDWYHPHHAWQHTEEEVQEWLEALGVREFRFNDANPNGISTLLTKPAD